MRFVNTMQEKMIGEMLEHFGIKEMIKESERDIILTLLRKVEKEGMERLIQYLCGECDFFTAPASTKFHGNYEGALAVHSLNVLALLTKKNNDYGLGLTDDECIISALMHDLCKVNFYATGYRNVKVYRENGAKSDNGGRFDWVTQTSYEINDSFPVGHGDKSIIMLQNFMKLTTNEILLIRWHMGAFSVTTDYEYNNAVNFLPIIAAMHSADAEAAALMEIKLEADEKIEDKYI